MRKKIQAIAAIGILLAAMITAKSALASYVEEKANWTMPVYDEIYLCMNFEDIVMEETGEGLRFNLKEGLSTTKLENLQKDITKLEDLMEEFPEVEESLTEAMYSDKKLDMISFTRAILPEGKNTFLLYTSVYEEIEQANGEYLYTAVTNGVWSDNSMAGGSDYPAAGDDFVTQTYSGDFVMVSDSFSSKYDYEPFMGENGQDYWCTDGAEHFIKYGVIDDPFGYRQNQSFSLTTETVTKQSEEEFQVVSCYTHSWDSEFADVTFESDTAKSEPNCWKVYNYVRND